MLILPDRTAPVGRFLLPQLKSEWRAASAAQAKDQFGNEDQVRFRLTARLSDGHPAWRGWFDDRDDADAFLHAMVTDRLASERALWDLPTPSWRPGMGELLQYDFATVVFLTTTTGVSQTYTRPTDWNAANNFIEVLAGGGSGPSVCGGGASAYARTNNVPLGATADYLIGLGAASGSAAAATNGRSGQDSYFNGASFAASSCAAKAGLGATYNTGASTGGLASASIGDLKYDGGSSPQNTGRGGTGGGGSAGPHGAGSNGSTNTGNGFDAGGAGDNGNTAAPAFTDSANGLDGTQWDGTHGVGSGGNGGNGGGTTHDPGGNAGKYGAGAGGGGFGNTNATYGACGTGAQGLIVITYTPGNFVRLERGVRGVARGVTLGTIH